MIIRKELNIPSHCQIPHANAHQPANHLYRMTSPLWCRGVGSALPSSSVDNATLARTKNLDTSDDWIVPRTGIKQRFIASTDETTSTLAIAAANAALTNAGITAQDIQLIIVATSTPDKVFPPCATLVQGSLGAHKAIALDINVACSGFVFGMAMAESYMRMSGYTHALLIGAETMSRIVDWSDRSTAVLFGDGAGAVVLSAHTNTKRGLQGHALFTDGRHDHSLYVDGGIGSTARAGHIRMNGKAVFRHAVTQLENATRCLLDTHGLTVDDIDWVIPHQANKRILESMCTHLGFPSEKMIFTGNHHANTSAASIPLAWDRAHTQGQLAPGHRIIIQSFGAGFTWGAYLIVV